MKKGCLVWVTTPHTHTHVKKSYFLLFLLTNDDKYMVHGGASCNLKLYSSPFNFITCYVIGIYDKENDARWRGKNNENLEKNRTVLEKAAESKAPPPLTMKHVACKKKV